MDSVLLKERLTLACSWLVDVAQVKSEDGVTAADRDKHPNRTFTGAIRGEYRASRRQWGFYCPVWHTGQAVKALALAAPFVDPRFVEAGRLSADFLLANRLTDGPDSGLLLAWEDFPDRVTVSAVLETVDGLFAWSALTGDPRYAEAALAAVDWVQRKAVLPGRGLLRDLYNPVTAEFSRFAGAEGRPLFDDGVFLTAHRLSGRPEYLETALAIAERLVADEAPAGNWINYAPCDPSEGTIHPRHAYWWGRPFLSLYEHTGEVRWREQFLRSCAWYRQALRRDGGFIRGTDPGFNSDSFGHETSGAMAAAVMFLEARRTLGDTAFDAAAEKVLDYGLKVQFTRPEDPNLKGAILEKVLYPDGTDASPYHLRDLGTIFFVQAASAWYSLSHG